MARNGAAKQDDHESEEIAEIPVPLADGELVKRNHRMSEVVRDIQAREDDRRRRNKVWNEEHKKLKAEAVRLSAITLDRAEPKRGRYKVVRDFTKGEVRYYDLKSGELLHTLDLKKDDRQLPIGDRAPEKSGGPAGSDKPPKGAGPRLTGRSKQPDVETPRRRAAPTPEAGGDELVPAER